MLRELITFQVEGQVFALDIMAIREIRAWSPATRLPRVPAYVAGVVNLRGTVLPVIDLAARLGWTPVEATPRHAIIVTQLGGLPSADVLKRNAQVWEPQFARRGASSSFLLPLLVTRPDWDIKARILTDQYSPSNLLNAEKRGG